MVVLAIHQYESPTGAHVSSHPEPPSRLPPHPIPLGRPREPAFSALLGFLNRVVREAVTKNVTEQRSGEVGLRTEPSRQGGQRVWPGTAQSPGEVWAGGRVEGGVSVWLGGDGSALTDSVSKALGVCPEWRGSRGAEQGLGPLAFYRELAGCHTVKNLGALGTVGNISRGMATEIQAGDEGATPGIARGW